MQNVPQGMSQDNTPSSTPWRQVGAPEPRNRRRRARTGDGAPLLERLERRDPQALAQVSRYTGLSAAEMADMTAAELEQAFDDSLDFSGGGL